MFTVIGTMFVLLIGSHALCDILLGDVVSVLATTQLERRLSGGNGERLTRKSSITWDKRRVNEPGEEDRGILDCCSYGRSWEQRRFEWSRSLCPEETFEWEIRERELTLMEKFPFSSENVTASSSSGSGTGNTRYETMRMLSSWKIRHFRKCSV